MFDLGHAGWQAAASLASLQFCLNPYRPAYIAGMQGVHRKGRLFSLVPDIQHLRIAMHEMLTCPLGRVSKNIVLLDWGALGSAGAAGVACCRRGAKVLGCAGVEGLILVCFLALAVGSSSSACEQTEAVQFLSWSQSWLAKEQVYADAQAYI